MSPNLSKPKILLVDDHAVVRAGFRYIIEGERECEILEVNTAEEACSVYNDFKPDVVIMDLIMPGMGGLEGLRHLHAKDNKANILVLSMRDDPIFIDRARHAGAKGYLTKRSVPQELNKAIDSVMKGQNYFSSDVSGTRMKITSKDDDEKLSGLSEREFEIFCLMAEGKSVVTISSSLHLSPKTVSNHRTRIMQKLQTKSMVEITRLAIRHGLIEA
jgi:two-component system invasion response regulator UvrY